MYVDETENETLFIVAALIASSRNDINDAYYRFKKKESNHPFRKEQKSMLFNEFKSNMLDNNYQRLKH